MHPNLVGRRLSPALPPHVLPSGRARASRPSRPSCTADSVARAFAQGWRDHAACRPAPQLTVPLAPLHCPIGYNPIPSRDAPRRDVSSTDPTNSDTSLRRAKHLDPVPPAILASKKRPPDYRRQDDSPAALLSVLAPSISCRRESAFDPRQAPLDRWRQSPCQRDHQPSCRGGKSSS